MAAIFSQILNMSMTGSIVILLVMLARVFLKRSPKIFSHTLWSVVLFRLLCPVAFTAPVSVLNALEPEVQEASESTSVVYFLPAEVSKDSDFTFVPAENQSGTEGVKAGESEHTRFDLMTVASYVWITGTGIMILCSVIQYIRLRGKLVGAMAYRGNVYRADYIDTPFVMGIFSPKIYLPSDVPMSERKYIIAHERHHIRRCDHIIKLLAYFALCIHWFNPLVWAAFILAGKDMEMSCDEAVIRKMGSQIRADYSASLLRLATHKKIIAGMPLAFGEGDTKGRVMNMAKWKKPRLWVSLICLLLCTTILVACAVNPQGEKESLEEMSRTIGPASVGIGSLFFTLPQEYTIELMESEVQSEGGLIQYEHIIRKNEAIVGGVYELTYPDFEWSSAKNNTWDWVTALNVPENVPEERLMLSVSTGIDTPYSLSASYGKNGTEETVHHFFEGELCVYDLWFNMEMLSEAEKNAFLDTARMEPPEEGESISIEVEPGQTADSSTPTKGNHVRTNLELITYGSLKMALTEQFESKEEEGNIIITKDGIDVGGIRHWNYPDFQPSDIVDLKKEESGALIGYMSGSSAYGDVEYDVFWDGNPDGLNEKHTFFTDGDILYDVWYDQNLISGAEAARFLGTVLLDNESNEIDALNQCKSVLNTIQERSYHIACHKSTTAPGSNHELSAAYFSHNEDWMHITYLNVGNGDIETQHRMKVNGKILYNVESPVKDNIVWSDGDISEPELPWLINHKWDESKVVFKDMHQIPDQKTITVQINEPFYAYPEESKSYIVTFFFDGSGNFLQVTLQAEVIRSNGVWTEEETQSVVSLDPEIVNDMIQAEYQRIFG